MKEIRHKAESRGPQYRPSRSAAAGSAKKPSIILMIVKTFLILVLLLALLMMIFYLTESIYEYGYSADESNTVDLCNSFYYDGDYARLRNELVSEDLTTETYDMYWEITDAYNDYMQWLSYSRCSEDELPGAADIASQYRGKVTKDAENCRFEENRSRIGALAALVNPE